jgi:hypothetical protein
MDHLKFFSSRLHGDTLFDNSLLGGVKNHHITPSYQSQLSTIVIYTIITNHYHC